MGSQPRESEYQITFRSHLKLDDIADSLTLAVCAAEGLHGRAKVRLDGAWWLDRQRRLCRIDAKTQVGRDIARLFIGFLIEEHGEGAFRVRRPSSSREVDVEARTGRSGRAAVP